jgi:hypothetical protein
MNQKEIIALLNNYSNNTKLFAGKLSNLCKLLLELKKMEGYKIDAKDVKGNLELVSALPKIVQENYKAKFLFDEAEKSYWNLTNLFGEFELWQDIEITHLKGCYKFNLPLNNAFYYKFMSLVGIEVESPVIELKQPLKTILVSSTILEAIKKAKNFISKDNLRPAMGSVCLHFEKNTCQVVATDAHQMFLSRLFPCNSGAYTFNLLISNDSFKAIGLIKKPVDEIEIVTFENFIGTIAGIDVNYLDANFPDYKCVIPDYESSMTFDRVQLIEKVKSIEIYANCTTKQINFHLNGSIELSAQDVDFSFESTENMPYINKSFVDMDIAFNADLIKNSLSIFKTKEIKMYSEGSNTRAAIFTDNVDSVLLMPLMLNN